MALMNKKTPESGGQTKNWYKDRYESVLTQRNFLGVIALSSLILALVSATVVWVLVQSKTVIPFLIQVDDKTGVTQVVNAETQQQITADEALRKYFVVKFIQAREGYDAADIDINSNVVRLLAKREIFNEFRLQVINPQNKKSLYVTLGAQYIRQVKIKSVQFLDANRAQVRFSVLQRRKYDAQVQEEKHYVALMTFEFKNFDLTMDERMINPLSFQVQEYKIDDESFL